MRATGWDGGQTVFTKLGGRSTAFSGALLTARETLSRQSAEVFARLLPTLGAGSRAELAAQWLPGRLLTSRISSGCPGVRGFLLSLLARHNAPRRGRARHDDRSGDLRSLSRVRCSAEGESPFLWLLVVKGETASLEVLSHDDYATYLFRGGEDLPGLIQGLVRLPEFSREALYLPIEKLTGERGIYAIPARDLRLLRDLRSRFAGRKIHSPVSSVEKQ